RSWSYGQNLLPRWLPAGFLDARKLTLVSQFPEANPAHAEFPHVGMRPTAKLAAVTKSHLIFDAMLLRDHGFFRQFRFPSLMWARLRVNYLSLKGMPKSFSSS